VDYVARTPAQLGPILRSYRTESGLTQKAAGAKVGLKQSTVSTVERDAARASVETLYKLLSALELELVIREKSGHREPSDTKKREW